MKAVKQLFYTLCDVFVLIAVGGLIVPSFSYGKNSSPPPIEEADDSPGQGDERRNNPCGYLPDPPGKANGIDKHCPPLGSSGGVARGDFNGDGIADLAIGVPYEDINGYNAVGTVNIIYGSGMGLTSSGDQLLEPRTFGYPLHSNDHFGWALASGDFNGDGYADLAIGMPDYEALQNEPNVGRVFLVNGGANGLNLNSARSLDTVADARGRQGAALVWGDFNGDGYGDLAVGIPEATAPGDGFACSRLAFDSSAAGKVHVYYGSASGLTTFGAQVFRQGVCDFGTDGDGVGDSPEGGDRFGSSLTALRRTNGADDLVIGAPYEDLGLFDKIDAGIVHVIPGFRSGLDPFYAQILSQDTPGVGGAAETGDLFGRTLASGDVDGDGRGDLVIGVPNEDLSSNTEADAGGVHVFMDRDADRFIPSASLFISQASIPGVSVEAGDRFGWALAIGDFDGDGYGDLAIGSPGEDFSGLTDAGLVSVLYGTSNGPSTTRTQNWTQDSSGVIDVAEEGDQFGYALSAWNFGNGSRADLAIGAPFEDLVSTITETLQEDAGAVNVLYGSATGLTATGNQFWNQDSPGILDAAQTGDRFGSTLY
ncbi:MAG TPA: integrin alpha [Methylomirabilota bacterium]|nr:integrin alpha [Methylomirabilota bacterium]